MAVITLISCHHHLSWCYWALYSFAWRWGCYPLECLVRWMIGRSWRIGRLIGWVFPPLVVIAFLCVVFFECTINYFVPKSKLDGYISFSLKGDEDVLDLVDIQQRLFMLTRFAHTYTKLNKTIPNANVRFTDSLPSYTFTIRPLHWPGPTKSVRKSLYTILIIIRPLLIAK